MIPLGNADMTLPSEHPAHLPDGMNLKQKCQGHGKYVTLDLKHINIYMHTHICARPQALTITNSFAFYI